LTPLVDRAVGLLVGGAVRGGAVATIGGAVLGVGGTVVGTVVGMRVVGFFVGLRVGLFVGVRVGFFVVGLPVGFFVGLRVGLVGFFVGLRLVGFFVGLRLGFFMTLFWSINPNCVTVQAPLQTDVKRELFNCLLIKSNTVLVATYFWNRGSYSAM